VINKNKIKRWGSLRSWNSDVVICITFLTSYVFDQSEQIGSRKEEV